VGKRVIICPQSNCNSCSGEFRCFKSPAKYKKVRCFGWHVYYQRVIIFDDLKALGAFCFWFCYFCNRRILCVLVIIFIVILKVC